MEELLREIKCCTICKPFLVHGPRPVLSIHSDSRIILIGQAPGMIVHKSGVPWEDKSGDNLRKWLGVNSETFYNHRKIGILPMGFCYPGSGKTGDLAPRKECAPQWHRQVMDKLNKVRLIILIGKYAQDYYLGNRVKANLTETVRNFKDYLPEYMVLPHPSPRNNRWIAKNPWFSIEVIPELQDLIRKNIMSPEQ